MAIRKRYENNFIAGLNNAAVDIASGVVGKKTLSKWLGAGDNVSDEDAEKIVNTLRMGGEGDTNTYDKDSVAYKAGKYGGYAGGAYAAGGVVRAAPAAAKLARGAAKSPVVWSTALGGAGLLGLNEINNGGTNSSSSSNNSSKTSDDIPEQKAPSQGSGTSGSSGNSKSSTVSNNKTNTMGNNNTAPAKQAPQQYQPEDYEAWRQRKMANGTSYNEVFENAVDKFIADPSSFTQEQKNALIEMGNKLGYDLGTTATSTATPEYHPQPQNNSYYSNQGDYNFRFSL